MAIKSIIATVGFGGANLPNDVMTVQYLLNCVPIRLGGPVPELAIDGFVGPLTNIAIWRFQHTQFGWSDGLVEPESQRGATIVRLNTFDRNPLGPISQITVPNLIGKRKGKKDSARQPRSRGQKGAKRRGKKASSR
jgi:hypothetical protein